MAEIAEQHALSYTTSEASPSQLIFNNTNQTHQISLQWDMDLEKLERDKVSMFVCNLCMKTFYNKNALQNHKNVTHDVADNEETVDLSTCARLEQDVNGLCGFKFIPLNPEKTDQCYSVNGIITRNFSEDTSYLIVKADYDDGENYDGEKPSHLENQYLVKKSIQNSEKPSIDIRGPFTCTLPSTVCPDIQCRQIFFSCCEYSLHYRDEHTKRRKAAVRCQVCEKRLDKGPSTDSRLAAELYAANSFILLCRVCGVQFQDQFQFDEHNRLMHAKMKPHECSVCSKRFAQLGGLQQHLRMHTGVRPFVCTFCPKAFTQKAGLDQHLRIHTKVKPFKCVVCSKCFSQSVHLRQHMRTHTNIQPFECSVCTKRFKQRSHLNFHLRSHMIDEADRYEEAFRQQNEINFFNLGVLQPVQDGQVLYYAADLTGSSTPKQPENLDLPNHFENRSLPILDESTL